MLFQTGVSKEMREGLRQRGRASRAQAVGTARQRVEESLPVVLQEQSSEGKAETGLLAPRALVQGSRRDGLDVSPLRPPGSDTTHRCHVVALLGAEVQQGESHLGCSLQMT